MQVAWHMHRDHLAYLFPTRKAPVLPNALLPACIEPVAYISMSVSSLDASGLEIFQVFEHLLARRDHTISCTAIHSVHNHYGRESQGLTITLDLLGPSPL